MQSFITWKQYEQNLTVRLKGGKVYVLPKTRRGSRIFRTLVKAKNIRWAWLPPGALLPPGAWLRDNGRRLLFLTLRHFYNKLHCYSSAVLQSILNSQSVAVLLYLRALQHAQERC